MGVVVKGPVDGGNTRKSGGAEASIRKMEGTHLKAGGKGACTPMSGPVSK